MLECYMGEYTESSYYSIWFRYLITALGLNLKLSEHIIKVNCGQFENFTVPMVYLDMYEFKSLNVDKTTRK